ncbi:hypothetical protein OIDMADRAFT_159630 [Oidiodendron maius Zn]|uniref:Uncharacterized protein n=1 Tax=Oidiodendron maius (strain Zn) TaxID=913774 RepID=A0A0C3HMK9_OIDMZ|nr:hypothetical protein OIDMADRAFT_159630 [Oidiodendron maius Zn]
MGKTAPLKRKGASVHSRAAKRASSPSIDTDKSLKNIKPPTESKTHRPSVLAVHQGAGVSKKSKHSRKSVLSAKAKRRQERGMDRAEAVMDKIEKKVEKSKGKARKVQERAKAWEELNKSVLTGKTHNGVPWRWRTWMRQRCRLMLKSAMTQQKNSQLLLGRYHSWRMMMRSCDERIMNVGRIIGVWRTRELKTDELIPCY